MSEPEKKTPEDLVAEKRRREGRAKDEDAALDEAERALRKVWPGGLPE
jgi:hypothetical protein